ncbi:MAG TPA: hypothetical protein VGF98_04950 [Candidatus Tumulicola sp.]|jgi:hypothetical protein
MKNVISLDVFRARRRPTEADQIKEFNLARAAVTKLLADPAAVSAEDAMKIAAKVVDPLEAAEVYAAIVRAEIERAKQ